MGAGREDSGARPPSLPNPHVYPDPNHHFLEGGYLYFYEEREKTQNKQHAHPSTPPTPGTRGSEHCAHGTPHNRLTTQAQYVLQGAGGEDHRFTLQGTQEKHTVYSSGNYFEAAFPR